MFCITADGGDNQLIRHVVGGAKLIDNSRNITNPSFALTINFKNKTLHQSKRAASHVLMLYQMQARWSQTVVGLHARDGADGLFVVGWTLCTTSILR